MELLSLLAEHGFAAEGGMGSASRFAVGRPDQATFPVTAANGAKLVAKVYPDERGQATFRNMKLLWESPFGEHRAPAGLPRPVSYLEEVHVLVMERLEGRTLLEIALSDERVDAAAGLLADLHRSGVRPARHRSARKLVLSARRKAARIDELAPRHGPELQRIVEALDAARCRDAELVSSHGDFSPRNVLVGDGRCALIDWDRLQSADPARDVAYFGTWCWVNSLRQKRGNDLGGAPAPFRQEARETAAGDWSILDQLARAYRSHRPEVDLTPRLGFHIAVGLLRIAQGSLELWPEDAPLVPSLLAEALRRLT